MIALQTVLCPVDFSPATPRQIDLAAELCRAFDARLVLHHNRHSLGAGASVGWMWNADHHGDSRTVLDAKLHECLARVPDGIRVEPLTTEGPPSRAVLAAGDLVQADLFVLTAHGTLSDDHASITRKVIEDSGRAVLVLHEASVEPRTPRFATSTEPQIVLAPTDLNPVPGAAMELALDLARQLPIELHLLHVIPKVRGWRGHEAVSDEDVLGRLRALVPDELSGRVQVHVEHGDIGHGIAAAADHLSAACIVMGEHISAARRWFGRSTPEVVLHEAHCPVWYVPNGQAA
jgi:nucleotide-binding universal stress UspA family protein